MQSNGIMPGGPPPGMGQQPFMGRPPLPGQPRPPNGGPPFQSPTMAHSPPNAGPSQPQHMQPQHGAPPMGQLGPPHRGMLPPGQGMNPGQQTATPYQNIAGRPPSRASTPQSGMMNPSPSMASRQPPGTMGDPRQQENNINAELQSISPQILAMVKAEIGLAEKNIASMTVAEKVGPSVVFLSIYSNDGLFRPVLYSTTDSVARNLDRLVLPTRPQGRRCHLNHGGTTSATVLLQGRT